MDTPTVKIKDKINPILVTLWKNVKISVLSRDMKIPVTRNCISDTVLGFL